MGVVYLLGEVESSFEDSAGARSMGRKSPESRLLASSPTVTTFPAWIKVDGEPDAEEQLPDGGHRRRTIVPHRAAWSPSSSTGSRIILKITRDEKPVIAHDQIY